MKKNNIFFQEFIAIFKFESEPTPKPNYEFRSFNWIKLQNLAEDFEFR